MDRELAFSDYLEKSEIVYLGEESHVQIYGTVEYSLEKRDDLEYFLDGPFELRKIEKDEPALLKGHQKEQVRDVSNEVVSYLNTLLDHGINNGCSDIHIEPLEHKVRIRLRKNGALYTHAFISSSSLSPLLARVKILSQLDISERRRPQDGRFSFPLKHRSVDIRVSTIPVKNGEKAVLRILDPYNLEYSFEGIGMNGEQTQIIERLLNQPLGLILLCGPTGSGKTSSLYAFLRYLNHEDKNIITIEDPVEYNLEGINQINVNPKAGITFETGLKSMLRQDPEILMVGEIRNQETAEIALRSSITGHLIFSTLHANSSPSAIIRLLDMGIEPYMITSGLIAVISQRLVRILCPECKRQVLTTDEYLGLYKEKTYKPVGCPHCDNGFTGRRAVFEILLLNDDIRPLIHKDVRLKEIEKRAEEMGMISLRDNLIHMIRAGETSVDEAYRAISTL